LALSWDRSCCEEYILNRRTKAKQEVRELRRLGLTYAGVARIFGVSAAKAKQALQGEKKSHKRRQPEPETNTMLTTSQVAKQLGLHPNTVRRWDDAGLLTSRRLGSRGDRRFGSRDVEMLRFKGTSLRKASLRSTTSQSDTRGFEPKSSLGVRTLRYTR